MFVSTLLVMMMSAHAEAPSRDADGACTEPLLSYSADAVQDQGRETMTCLICADKVTWHVSGATDEKRAVTYAIAPIGGLHATLDAIRHGHVSESLDAGSDWPMTFYWAHPRHGAKFLIKARQQDHVWTNNAAQAADLVENIEALCSGAVAATR